MSMIRRIFSYGEPKIEMYSHFHRPFVFDKSSSWIQARSFIDDLSDVGIKSLPRGAGSVEDFRHYMPEVSDNRFAQIFGQQALEYWIYKKAPKCDFIGCTTYRRYLSIADAGSNPYARLVVEPNIETISNLGSDEHRKAALHYFKSTDVITNRTQALNTTVEQQYINDQSALYWHLMLKAIEDLFPKYRRHTIWFRDYNCINFETTYIMRRNLFMQYASELFAILNYIFKNAEVVVPREIPNARFQPYRYPGYLGERFFPFFIYANAIRKIEVPLIFVSD